MYGVYDLKNKEQCIGTFDTANELAEFFNKPLDSLRSAITRNNKIHNRYVIKKMEGDIMSVDNLFERMDKAYEDLYTEYYEFKANKTNANQKKLLAKIKTFNYIKNQFTGEVKHLCIISKKI